MIWLILAVLAIGLVSRIAGKSARKYRGLTDARTHDLGRRNLYSARLSLTGRPDRVVLENGYAIPEEWKSSQRFYDPHKTQMATNFPLIAE